MPSLSSKPIKIPINKDVVNGMKTSFDDHDYKILRNLRVLV